MKNTWPNNKRQALDQSEHERWNSYNYPGTRQICTICDEPTGRCEEDGYFIDSDAVCRECYIKKESEL